MKDSVEKIFGKVKDPRVINRCDHKLIDILFIAYCTLLSNGEDYEDMVEFGHQKKEWLSTILELPNGIPSHDTFNRVLQLINPKSLFSSLTEDGSGLLESLKGKLISFDGKKIKGVSPKSRGNTGLFILSAWVNEHRLCIGQKRVKDKSNEITAIPELLEELEVKESIISIDAIGCQTEIASKIKEKEADYILAVKGNQKDLLEEVTESFQYSKVVDYSENWEYDHGRYEERKCEILDAKKCLSPIQIQKWPSVNTLVKITAKRMIKDNSTIETRFYISSLTDYSSEKYNELVRGHWGIENLLHWHLDVTFKEDASRARSGNAPENLNILRKMALTRIRMMTDKLSLNKRRFRAALNHKYLQKILNNQF